MTFSSRVGRVGSGCLGSGRAGSLLSRSALLAAAVVAGAGASLGGLPSADPVSRLSGRWAGQGTVTMTSGPAESFKCVVNYLPAHEANRLHQNLRCSNDSFKLDAATHLLFEGNAAGSRVSGRWEDKIHDLEGEVSGVLTAGGFDIRLAGQFFQAHMAVDGNECEQSVRVRPTRGGMDVREIQAALRRC